jgi:transcriptional regulator with XRE-family HTH domain
MTEDPSAQPEPSDEELELQGDAENSFLKSFGKQVKLFRERMNMSQVDLGKRLGHSQSQIASVEQGRRIMQPKIIDRADDVLDAGGVLSAMKDEVARAAFPRFFQDAERYEARAVELHVYDTMLVNGLLQTEEYARALYVMRRPVLSEELIEQRVTARLSRQKIFSRTPAPIMSFVMDEVILRKPFGGREVLRGQLENLLLFGRMRNVEIQVMPMDREDNAGVGGPFKLMETEKQERIAYVEVQGSSRLYTERKPVRELEVRYGIIRAQALSPRDSLTFIEKLLGER